MVSGCSVESDRGGTRAAVRIAIIMERLERGQSFLLASVRTTSSVPAAPLRRKFENAAPLYVRLRNHAHDRATFSVVRANSEKRDGRENDPDDQPIGSLVRPRGGRAPEDISRSGS